jgi:hypothetical protein
MSKLQYEIQIREFGQHGPLDIPEMVTGAQEE